MARLDEGPGHLVNNLGTFLLSGTSVSLCVQRTGFLCHLWFFV